MSENNNQYMTGQCHQKDHVEIIKERDIASKDDIDYPQPSKKVHAENNHKNDHDMHERIEQNNSKDKTVKEQGKIDADKINNSASSGDNKDRDEIHHNGESTSDEGGQSKNSNVEDHQKFKKEDDAAKVSVAKEKDNSKKDDNAKKGEKCDDIEVVTNSEKKIDTEPKNEQN